jgi:hypothetical protein
VRDLVARVEVVGPVDFSGVNRKRIARCAYNAINCALSGDAIPAA